jgi:hypothetical protein
MKTRDAFHDLIENIKDEEVLKGYFSLIQRLNTHQTGKLWDSLSSEEKDELLLSYEESFDNKNLLTHEEVKNQQSGWLGK